MKLEDISFWLWDLTLSRDWEIYQHPPLAQPLKQPIPQRQITFYLIVGCAILGVLLICWLIECIIRMCNRRRLANNGLL